MVTARMQQLTATTSCSALRRRCCRGITAIAGLVGCHTATDFRWLQHQQYLLTLEAAIAADWWAIAITEDFTGRRYWR